MSLFKGNTEEFKRRFLWPQSLHSQSAASGKEASRLLVAAMLLGAEGRGQDSGAWVKGQQAQGVWAYLLLQDLHLLSFLERQVVWMDAIIGVQGYHDVSLLLRICKEGRKGRPSRIHQWKRFNKSLPGTKDGWWCVSCLVGLTAHMVYSKQCINHTGYSLMLSPGLETYNYN